MGENQPQQFIHTGEAPDAVIQIGKNKNKDTDGTPGSDGVGKGLEVHNGDIGDMEVKTHQQSGKKSCCNGQYVQNTQKDRSRQRLCGQTQAAFQRQSSHFLTANKVK